VTQVRDLVLSIGRLYCDLIFRGLDALPALGEERLRARFRSCPAAAASSPRHILPRSAARRRCSPASAPILSRARSCRPCTIAASICAGWNAAPDAGPQPTVAMVKDGDRAFLSRRAGPARPATLAEALASPIVRHLHIAEFATLAEIPDLVIAAKHAGLSVSLDPSWDDDLIHRFRTGRALRRRRHLDAQRRRGARDCRLSRRSTRPASGCRDIFPLS
jgi:hypothetical protein